MATIREPFFSLNNKWFVWLLFFPFFTYLVLRACFVEPLLDELATLYWYIQTGDSPTNAQVLDPNNHLLNSYISHRCYLLFGDHLFVYRLFAVSTFPLYFYALKKLVQSTIKENLSILVFLALISIHWIFDYFGFCRGYSPSLAFFFYGCYQLYRWNSSPGNKRLVLILTSFFLALLCNLALFVPINIVVLYGILCSILRWKTQSIRGKLATYFLFTAYLSGMIPVYNYVDALKKAGGLSWGSTAGLWEVTGKSLAQNVLFSEATAWKYVFIFLLALLVVLFILEWRKKGFLPFIFTIQFWIPGLFFLCLVAAVFMAEVMQVNYPMDRVGMYLAPLFIFSAALLLHTRRILSWMLLTLVWFPLSFVWKMNLDTSVFSPSDRMHRSFFEQLQAQAKESDRISADYVSHVSYAYLTRTHASAHMAIETSDDECTRGDYHIAWFEPLDWKGYHCIAHDPVSNTRLYKKDHPSKRRLLLDTVLAHVQSAELRIPLLEVDLRKINYAVQTQVSADVVLAEGCLGLNLTHEILQENEVSRFFQPTRFDWYFGKKTRYSFNFPNQPFVLEPTDRKLLVFMMNNNFLPVTLNNIRIRIFEVERTKPE